jgi:hypothetical protein
MIVGGVSLEAAPAARQDDAETASIIVNGREGLYEHGHRGDPCGTRKQRKLYMVPRIRTRRQGSCQARAEHFQQCAAPARRWLLLSSRNDDAVPGGYSVTVSS